jgi:ribosome biogenesis GTPase
MSATGLERWGWTPDVAEAWDRALVSATGAIAGTIPGRVAAEHRGACDVGCADGVVRAHPDAAQRHAATSGDARPAVGDWVALRTDAAGGDAAIAWILPRRSAFVRRDPGREAAAQVVAANVDTVLVVTAVGRDVNARRLERYLAAAWGSGASPVIVVNKADLRDGLTDALRLAEMVAGAAPVLAVSARTGDGLAQLATHARPGSTVALLGSSGVGKSSLVNALVGEERMETGEVRADDDRGRHTTRARMLVPLGDGACLLDTPGMRALGMAGGETDAGLDAAFADVIVLAAACRFSDCGHGPEPGCAVRRAIADGSLPAERLASHERLVQEARAAAARLDSRARTEARREGRRRGVMYREILRAKYGEERGRW